jgi:chorismate lyase/3-hydroxybenzoate synthase
MAPSTAETMASTSASDNVELEVRLCSSDESIEAPGLEFFRFQFTTDPSGGLPDSTFQLYLNPLSDDCNCEIWYTNQPAVTKQSGRYRIAQAGDHLLVHTEIEIPIDEDFFNLTRNEYRNILQEVHRLGFKHLLRAWNYFPGINSGEGDNERYKLFAAGRGKAFDDLGYQETDLPAGTAIGTDPGTPFTISVLATKQMCTVLENPRQTSAYKYPREFGPRAPSFSRAVLLHTGANHQIIISGTASIVGYESVHLNDPEQQLIETLKNLKTLLTHAIEHTDSEIEPEHVGTPSLRVYLRNPGDYKLLRQLMQDNLSHDHRILYLHGDICRSELTLEIELAGKI